MALKSFLIIEQDILQDNKLTMNEKLILAYIRSFWRNKDQCFSSNNSIADYLNINRVSVIRAVKRLNLLGYITIRHLKSSCSDFKGNDLRVLEPPKIGQAEQLSLLFKSVVYGDKKPN